PPRPAVAGAGEVGVPGPDPRRGPHVVVAGRQGSAGLGGGAHLGGGERGAGHGGQEAGEAVLGGPADGEHRPTVLTAAVSRRRRGSAWRPPRFPTGRRRTPGRRCRPAWSSP